VEVNILGIITKMRMRLKVVSWEEFSVLGYDASSQQNTVLDYDVLSFPNTTFLGLCTIILVEFSPGLGTFIIFMRNLPLVMMLYHTHENSALGYDAVSYS